MAVLHHPCYRPSSEVILEFRLYRHYCKLTVSVPRLVAPLVMASPLTSPVASPLLSVNVGNTGNVSASAPASVNQYGSNDALAVQLSTMAAGIASMQSLTTDMCGIMRAACFHLRYVVAYVCPCAPVSRSVLNFPNFFEYL